MHHGIEGIETHQLRFERFFEEKKNGIHGIGEQDNAE